MSKHQEQFGNHSVSEKQAHQPISPFIKDALKTPGAIIGLSLIAATLVEALLLFIIIRLTR